MFKQHGVNLYHKPFNNLRKQLSNVKGKTPTLQRCSVIYHVKCWDYDHDNVGETARALGTGLKENQTRTSSVIDGFHSDVIKLQSQNGEVLRIRIYNRLKINKK